MFRSPFIEIHVKATINIVPETATVIVSKGDKPNAISWLVKFHPELKDSQIVRLIGTTKNTISKIRDRSHWNINNITAKNPVLLDLCNQKDLNKAILKAGGDPNNSEAQNFGTDEVA